MSEKTVRYANEPQPVAVDADSAVYYVRVVLGSEGLQETPASIFSQQDVDGQLFVFPELAAIPPLSEYKVGAPYLTYHILLTLLQDEPPEDIFDALAMLGDLTFEFLGGMQYSMRKEVTGLFSDVALANAGTPFEAFCAMLRDEFSAYILPVDNEQASEEGKDTSSQKDVTDAAALLAADDGGASVHKHSIAAGDALEAVIAQMRQVAESIPPLTLPSSTSHRPAKLDTLISRVGELAGVKSKMYDYALSCEDGVLRSLADEVERVYSMLKDTALDLRMAPVAPYLTELATWLAETADTSGYLTAEFDDGGVEFDADIAVSISNALGEYLRFCCGAASVTDSPLSVSLRFDYTGADIGVTVVHPLVAPFTAFSESLLRLQHTVFTLHGGMAVSQSETAEMHLQLSLPVTQAMVEGLLVQCGEDQFIVPVNQVVECIDCNSKMGVEARDNSVMVGGEAIPYVALREYLGQPRATEHEQCIIVQTLSGTFGLIVDGIVEEVHITVKPLGIVYEHIEMFSGVSLNFGDSPVLVLNLQHMQSVADCLIVS